MGTVVALLAVLGYGLYVGRFVKYPLESSLLFVCATLICLLYLSGLFGCLQLAAQILLGIGAVLFLVGVLSQLRSGTLVHHISPGVLFVLLSAIALWVLTRSSNYSHIEAVDDYGTWARMSRLIANNNRLIIPTDDMSFKDYPPGMALFDYLFLQFGEFSESRAMFSHGVFNIAALAQLFTVIPKTANRNVLFGVSIFIFALINSLVWFLGPGWYTLNADLMVAELFGIALFGYLADRKNRSPNSIIRLVPLVMVLPLIKQIGILFSFITVIVIVSDIMIGTISSREKFKLIFASTFLMMSCLLTYVTWEAHNKNMGLGNTLSTQEISPGNVIKAFIPALATERQRTTIDDFTRRVFQLHRNPHYWLALCLMFLWMIWRTGKNYSTLERAVPFAMIFSGYCLYLFVLLLLYLFSFGSYEGTRLASFNRYESTYLIGVVIVLFGVSVSQYFENKQDRTTTISLIVICFLAMLPHSERGVLDVYNAIKGVGRDKDFEYIIQYSQEVVRVTPPNSHVYFIWQGMTHNEQNEAFNYGVMPRITNMGCTAIGEPYPRPDGDDVWTCPMIPSEFEQKLMDYDYLLIARTDKKFMDRFLPQFGLDSVQDGSLFQISKENGRAKLILVSLAPGQTLQ